MFEICSHGLIYQSSPPPTYHPSKTNSSNISKTRELTSHASRKRGSMNSTVITSGPSSSISSTSSATPRDETNRLLTPWLRSERTMPTTGRQSSLQTTSKKTITITASVGCYNAVTCITLHLSTSQLFN